jgi:RsiW-degrading membrane proteinase PrsW (M82 family)
VAISPVPIIAVILMLFSERARTNAPAFLVGWVLGMAIAGGIILAVADQVDYDPDSGPTLAASIIKLLLGLLLLGLAVRQWQGRPKPEEELKMPRWMGAIDAIKPGAALGLGVVLSGVNPKNLVLTLGAALTIAQAPLSATQAVVSLVVFIIVASLTVALPVLIYFFMPDRAEGILDSWEAWLGENNATLMFVLLLVLGVVLLGQGIGGLAG